MKWFADRAKKHVQEKTLTWGTFWDKTSETGCSIGCMIHDGLQEGLLPTGTPMNGFHALAKLARIPVFVIAIAEKIYEALEDEDRTKFHLEFWSKLDPEHTSSSIQHDFLSFLLNHKEFGFSQYTNSPSVCNVAKMYQEPPGTYSKAQWLEAEEEVSKGKDDPNDDAPKIVKNMAENACFTAYCDPGHSYVYATSLFHTTGLQEIWKSQEGIGPDELQKLRKVKGESKKKYVSEMKDWLLQSTQNQENPL